MDLAKIHYLENVDRFDVAKALYWYASNYHSGQWSDLYRILSTLPYKPGATERDVSCEDDSAEVYEELVNGHLDPQEVFNWLQAREEE